VKIAFVCDNVYPYYIGGIEKRVWELATRLSKMGNEVHLYTMKYWCEDNVTNKEGVWLHGVCLPQPLFTNGRRSVRQAIYFAWHLFGPLKAEKFDIIDCQHSPYFSIITSYFVSKLGHSKLIVTWHAFWGNYWFSYMGIKGIIGLLIEWGAAHLSQNIITVSDPVMCKLRGLGIKADQIEVIPNGVDIDMIANVRASREKYDLIYVGRLIKDKGVVVLIQAVSLLAPKFPNLRCMIIGHGPERENLERITNELGLAKNIIFGGQIKNYNNVISYMKSSRVLVLPTHYEGFGIVVLEANACGIPAVTTTFSDNAARDLISEGRNGLLYNGDAAGLAEKIFKLFSQPKKWEDECRRAARDFDWDLVTEKVFNFYHKVIVA
jgi:glycosyltransferase involved in cell wall biosynthesis